MNNVSIGGQGCVYTGSKQPVCSIPTEGVKRTDIVTKVYLSEEDYEAEYNIVRKLKIIDPHQEFIVYPINFCKVDANEVENCKSEIDYRRTKTTSDGKYNMGQIPRMEKTLDKYFNIVENRNIDYAEELLICFIQLLKGLKLLHENNLVYIDIKRNNVMVKDENYKFIDVGFIQRINEETYIREFIHSADYYIYCPACFLMKKKHQYTPTEIMKIYFSNLKRAQPHIMTTLLTDFNDENRLSDLENFFKEYKDKKFDIQMIKTMMIAQDVYGMGMMMIYMIATRIVMEHYIRLRPLKKILMKCIHQNPFKRPSVEELIDMLEELEFDEHSFENEYTIKDTNLTTQETQSNPKTTRTSKNSTSTTPTTK